MNYWLIIGKKENWIEAFELGNIWGFKKRNINLWNEIQENDIVLFYAIRPIAGLIGFGKVNAKFIQTNPLWRDEINKSEVIWPLRFEFDVEYCLPPDRWEYDKVSSESLRFNVNTGSQKYDSYKSQELIRQFSASEDREDSILQESSLHEEIKKLLVYIGKMQYYLAEDEYNFELGRLDVVWRRVMKSVPTFVFEIHFRGNLHQDLSKLKHAFELWNSKIFIVAPHSDREKVNIMLQGAFNDIANQLIFIDFENIRQIYDLKKQFKDLEKHLGIYS